MINCGIKSNCCFKTVQEPLKCTDSILYNHSKPDLALIKSPISSVWTTTYDCVK